MGTGVPVEAGSWCIRLGVQNNSGTSNLEVKLIFNGILCPLRDFSELTATVSLGIPVRKWTFRCLCQKNGNSRFVYENRCEAEFSTKIGPVEVPDRLHTCCGVHTWTYEHFKTRNDFFGFVFKKL